MWKKIKIPIFRRFSEFNTNEWQIWAKCKNCPNSALLDVQKLIKKYGDRDGFADINHVFVCGNCKSRGAKPEVCRNFKKDDEKHEADRIRILAEIENED